MKKRIIAILMVFVMAISLFPSMALNASASTVPQPIFSIEGVWAVVGTTVEVNVNIDDNPGLYGATLNISWAEGLTLVDAENGSVFNGLAFQEPSRYQSAGTNFIWYGTNLRQVQDGTVLKLTFQVADTAVPGSRLAVNITGNGMTDENNNAITALYMSDSIEVIDYLPGDTTSDNAITTSDLVDLAKYISDGCINDPDGFNVSVNESAADVNGDGEITTQDLVLIAKYLSDGCTTDPDGFNVVLKPSTPKCKHTNMVEEHYREATCTEPGNIAYWHCSACGKNFSDADGKTELVNVVLEATGHTMSEGWVYDQENHWHAAVCEHSALVEDKATHTFGDDRICDVCFYDISYMYKLATPQDVTVAYDVITWTAIPNADQYTIVVNGDYEYVTRSNQCSLTSVKNSAGQTLFADRTGINKHGEVSVVVYANDNGEYTKSDNSEAVTYYYVPDAGATQSDKQSQAENYGLGLGYNMVETGFNTGMQPGMAVFDVGKLLAIDQLTTSVLGTGGDSSIYYYTSIDDYIEQQSSSNKANVSIGGGIEKLFTASLKTDLSYGSNSSYTSHKYFTSYVSRVNKQTGLVNFGGQNSDIRIHCLSQQFLQDIRRESNTTKLMTDEQLCEYLYNTYGTHTALGIIKGGYFVTSYSLWTDSIEDLNSANAMFTMAVESKVGTFFNASAGVTAQGDHTITTKGETTVSQLISSYYGGSTGVSGDKAAFTDWNLTMGSDDVPLSFSNNGAIDISSLIELFEQEYGCLGTNGVSFGEIYGQYINDRADDLYHELYDKYTYEPPFDVKVVEEENKNVLVIDLSMYQADGKLDAAGCSYFVDGIFSVYPNMLGEDIDAIRLIGAMDKTNTNKQLLDGFSLALKGKWTNDVEIILENFGVEAASDYGIVDSTAIPKTTNVTVSYEGMNIVKDTSGIYYCYVEQGDTSCSFVLSDEDLPTWVFKNVSIDGDAIYLPVATKDNYVFAGWFDGDGNMIADALGKLDTTQQFNADTVTLKVDWKANTYTVQLDNQGAATSGTEKIYLMYGVGYAASDPIDENFMKLTSITIPTKKGYIFGGYYTRADIDANKVAVSGEIQYIDAEGNLNNIIGDGVAINLAFKDNVILYAKWIPVTYTVEYYADGDSADGNVLGGTVNSESHTYAEGKTFVPAVNGFTCYGKSFVCWNTKKDGTGTDYYPGESYNSLVDTNGAVVKLYAKWTDNIKVEFSAGQVASEFTTTLYMKPGGNKFYSDPDCKNEFTLTQFQIPTKEGYTFMGYYDSVDGNNTPNPTGNKQYLTIAGQKAVLADGVAMEDFSNGSKTLVAMWDLKEFTATWNSCANCTIVVNRTESPLANAATGVITNGTTIYYGDVLAIVYTPSTGYKITSNGETHINVKSKVTDTDIWAITELRSFTITYDLSLTDSDDVTGCYEDLSFTKKTYTVTYGTSYTLDVPTAEYYKFTGWYSADGKAIAYGDGKSLAKWTGLEDITVYARWTKEWNGVSYAAYTYIKTAEDFKNNILVSGAPRKILLINDITFTGYTGLGIWPADRILDGGGNTISGVYRDLTTTTGTYAEVPHTGLFSHNLGTIRNLTLNNWQLCESNHDHTLSDTHIAGLLCAENRGTIENVIIKNSKLYFDEGSLDQDTQNYAKVGLLCGYNTGTITNCTTSGNYVNVYVASHYQNAYAYVGGIVGQSAGGTITGCLSSNNAITVTAKADVNKNLFGKCKSHGRPYLYLGGVIGYTTGTSYSGLSASGNTLSSTVSRDCDCGTNTAHIRNDTVAYSG